MSDSLRDQLMKAGFEEKTPAAKPKSSQSGTRTGTRSGSRSGSRSGNHPGAGARPDAGQNAGSGKRRQRKRGKPADGNGAPTVSGTREISRGQAARTGGSRRQQEGITAEQAAAIEQRKANKARIKALIEANRVAEHAGESVYRFTQGSRIKQLFVNEAVRQQLIAGELLITRLNGTTHLVPPAIGEAILAINADWAMIHPGAASSAASKTDDDDEYADYQVPDDLQW